MVHSYKNKLSREIWTVGQSLQLALQHLYDDNLFVTPVLIIIHNAGRVMAPIRRNEAMLVYRLILYL